jgi:hypothetical protein
VKAAVTPSNAGLFSFVDDVHAIATSADINGRRADSRRDASLRLNQNRDRNEEKSKSTAKTPDGSPDSLG